MPMIHVALVTDARCQVPAAVTLASIAEHAEPEAPVTAHLFVDGVGLEDRERLAREPVLQRIGLELHTVEPGRCRGLESDIPYITPTTFHRLFLDEYLPELDRVIYLDVDLLVRASLRALWECDLEGRVAAGVRDGSIPFVSAPGSVEDWRDCGAEATGLYCNTGVMSIDLVQWRREEMARLTREYLRDRGGAARMGDQGAINAVLGGHWASLPATWNVQTEFFDPNNLVEPFLDPVTFYAAVENPAVVHFTGPAKPWKADCRHPFAPEWRAVLDRTSFAGWREPTRELPSPRRSPMRRLRKAAKVLLRG